MMYYLHRLSDQVGGFNVFFYVTFRAVAAAVTAFVVCLIFGVRRFRRVGGLGLLNRLRGGSRFGALRRLRRLGARA